MKYKDYKFLIMESTKNGSYYKEISFEEMIDLYRKNCKNNNVSIYRGTETNFGIYSLVEGQKGKRESANTSNHYTVIFDDLIREENKAYPLRSQSIIASANEKYAKEYGDLYRVIPFDDTWIGIVPKRDIWELEVVTHTDSFEIIQMNNLFESAGVEATNIKHISKQIEGMSKSDFEKHFKDIFKSQDDIEKQIREMYSLDKFGIEFVQSKDYTGSIGEVFIGGKCLMMKSDEYDRIIDVIKNGSGKTLYSVNIHRINGYDVDMYIDEIGEYYGDATMVDIDSMNIIKFEHYWREEIQPSDFFKYVDGYIKKSKNDEYMKYKEGDFSEYGRLYEYFQKGVVEKLIPYLDCDGFSFFSERNSDVKEYFILKK